MSNEIFKQKKGYPFANYTIVDALKELTYDWCNNDLKNDKYPSYRKWEKDCDVNDLPNIETIHNFLKQFVPRGLTNI